MPNSYSFSQYNQLTAYIVYLSTVELDIPLSLHHTILRRGLLGGELSSFPIQLSKTNPQEETVKTPRDNDDGDELLVFSLCLCDD